MWIIYYFYVDGKEHSTFTFSGNAHQRRLDARMIARSLKATYRIWKYAKGTAYSSGSFI